MTSLAHDTSNSAALDQALDDYHKAIEKLGAMKAHGDDSLTNLAILFARAISDEVETMNKDQSGADAAERAFTRYSAADGKKAYHNRTRGSQKSQCSKLRQVGKAAALPKVDFVDVSNRGMVIRQQAMKDELPVVDGFVAMVNMARDQLKQDDELSDEQLFACVTPRDHTKEKTLEGELKRAAKILEDIITGEKNPGVMDQSAQVMVAAEQINQRITELQLLADKQATQAKAIELGLISDPTDNLELAAAV